MLPYAKGSLARTMEPAAFTCILNIPRPGGLFKHISTPDLSVIVRKHYTATLWLATDCTLTYRFATQNAAIAIFIP